MMEEVGVCAIGMLPLRCVLGSGVDGIGEGLFAPSGFVIVELLWGNLRATRRVLANFA